MKIAFAAVGVVTGVLVLIQRIRELYETSRQEFDDAES